MGSRNDFELMDVIKYRCILKPSWRYLHLHKRKTSCVTRSLWYVYVFCNKFSMLNIQGNGGNKDKCEHLCLLLEVTEAVILLFYISSPDYYNSSPAVTKYDYTISSKRFAATRRSSIPNEKRRPCKKTIE